MRRALDLDMSSRIIITAPAMRPALERLGLQTYDDFAKCGLGEVVASRASAETRRILLSTDSGLQSLFLKVYRYSPLSWRTVLMRDKCSIERRNYAAMADDCGLATPEVIAFGARRSLGRLCDAFILTLGVPGAIALDEWWDLRGGGESLRSWAIAASASCAAAMHAAGFSHIDLQWRNLLVSEVSQDAEVLVGGVGIPGRHGEGGDRGGVRRRLYVLDSARGGKRWWSVRREHGRIRDLSSLSKGARGRLSRTEQLRWLCRYFGISHLGIEHRALVQTILRDRQLKDGDAR